MAKLQMLLEPALQNTWVQQMWLCKYPSSQIDTFLFSSADVALTIMISPNSNTYDFSTKLELTFFVGLQFVF